MIDNLLKQFSMELDRIKADEMRWQALTAKLNRSFCSAQVNQAATSSIDEQEDNYNLLGSVNTTQARVSGVITRLKQMGAQASKLKEQYETIAKVLDNDVKLSYKLLYNIARQGIPTQLKKQGDVVLQSATKIFPKATTKYHVTKDSKNDLCYGYYITIDPKTHIMLTQVVDARTGLVSPVGSRVGSQVKPPHEIWGEVKGEQNVLEDVIQKRGKTLSSKYDSFKIKNDEIVLTVKAKKEDSRFNRDARDRIINVNQNFIDEALNDILDATGLGKAQVKFRSEIDGDTVNLHFRILPTSEVS